MLVVTCSGYENNNNTSSTPRHTGSRGLFLCIMKAEVEGPI